MTDFQGDRCEVCKFSLVEGDEPKLPCRRFPPQAYVISVIDVGGPKVPETERYSVTLGWAFPLVLRAAVCGEFQRDPAKVPKPRPSGVRMPLRSTLGSPWGPW